ncbi:MAG: FxsA family protein [Porticoccaceae bacterium]
MRFISFLLFFVLPLAELWLLIRVGSVIGAGLTILLVLLGAVAGVAVLRWQGQKTLGRASLGFDEDELPVLDMVDGLIVATSGILLLLPGFATDVIALLGLIPWIRRALARRLMASADVTAYAVRRGSRYRGDSGRVIEAEYWREESRRE